MSRLVSIETARLLLRAYRESDVDDVFAYCADEAFSRYLPAVGRCPCSPSFDVGSGELRG